jgi:uncharacterized membrane protein
MTFDFPIRQALRTSWTLYKKHIGFFTGIVLVTLLLNIASDAADALRGWYSVGATLLLVLLAVVWGFVWVRVSLAVVRGDESVLQFSYLRNILPNSKQFLQLIGVGILTGFIVLGGFVALIIPGVYFMARLAFVNLALVDKNLTPSGAIKYSWQLVTGEKFWTVLLVLLVSVVLIAIGAITFGLGLIITYPLVMLLVAHLYKALDDFYLAQQTIEK